jgi:hypothetical protein
MKKLKKVIYIIWKGDMAKEGVAVKMRAIEGVLEFLKRTGAADYKVGRHTYLVTCEADEGDTIWLIQNCIGEGDLVGSLGHRDAEARAEKCVERYEDRRDGIDRTGHGVLKHYLDKWYMTYDMWED